MAGFTAGETRALFVLAYAAAVATAAADTCSSEIGKAYGRRTFLITTFRPVPPGHRGRGQPRRHAGRPRRRRDDRRAWARRPGSTRRRGRSPSRPPGLLGSLAESVIGTVAERRGWLDNDLLNALNTAIGAGIVILIAKAAA